MPALTCFSCGARHDPSVLQTTCRECALPLRVDVPLPASAPDQLISADVDSMWRYGPVLPVPPGDAVTLGEGFTPLLPVGREVWLKDESTNPTRSFKARGMAMAVSAARARGAARLVAPSAGNAALALSAYGRAAHLPVAVAMPEDTPASLPEACRRYGADVQLVAGTIAEAGRWLAEHREEGDFDVSTLKEPYRIEGKKTMAYELFEQFRRRPPEVVIYPTGGGTGLIGMWKAWQEMQTMGWIRRPPRMVSVQAEGCAPVVRAFTAGSETTERWEDPVTTAFGLRVPDPIGGFLCLRAVRETHGTAVTVPEGQIHDTRRSLAAATGVDISPEGGAAWAAYRQLRSSGWIAAGERTAVFNTGAGANYV